MGYRQKEVTVCLLLARMNSEGTTEGAECLKGYRKGWSTVKQWQVGSSSIKGRRAVYRVQNAGDDKFHARNIHIFFCVLRKVSKVTCSIRRRYLKCSFNRGGYYKVTHRSA